MAIPLHLSGVRTPYMSFSVRVSSCQPLRGQHHLRFGVSQPSVIGQFLPVNGLCGTLAMRLRCEAGNVDVLEMNDALNQDTDQSAKELTCVMKFGGSSVASADRMREVADLILGFPEERPVIVLSAMGKTTNKLLTVPFLFFSAVLSI